MREVRGESAWLLFPSDQVPEGWRQRAVGVALVALSAPEVERIAEDGFPAVLDDMDQAIVTRLSKGFSTPETARELGVSLRTIQRRLAHLRDRFHVTSTLELIARFGPPFPDSEATG